MLQIGYKTGNRLAVSVLCYLCEERTSIEHRDETRPVVGALSDVYILILT